MIKRQQARAPQVPKPRGVSARRAPEPDDIAEWPDGTWCFHEQLHEMTHMSDDYETIRQGTARWNKLVYLDEYTDPPNRSF
jgi:hypothetical protein